jgi:hypothetical protein
MSSGGLRSCVTIPRGRNYLRDEVLNMLQAPPLLIPVVVCWAIYIFILSLFHFNPFSLICPVYKMTKSNH